MSELPPLWPHQVEAIERAKDLSEFALLFHPGTGKTRTVLELIRYHYNKEKRILPTLIFAPVITLRNFVNEYKKYTKISPDFLHTLEGSQTSRCNYFASKILAGNPNQVVITNYEVLAIMPRLVELLKKWAPHIVVCDEMHYVKNSTANRSKALYTISDQAKIRYGLTGTVLLNSPLDIYGQWRYLDKGKTFGTNPFVFRGTYLFDRNAGMPKQIHYPDWRPRPDAISRLQKEIAPISATALKEEVLKNLPPLIKQRVYVEMTSEQKKHIKNLKEDLLTQLENEKFISATTALAKLAKLVQVTSGFLKDTITEEVTFFKTNPKAAALEELLENIQPEKTIVWCAWVPDYETVRKVCAKLKLPMVEATGQNSNAAKYAAVENFEKDQSLKVFLGNLAALGIGINLISASRMIYLSRGTQLGHDIQSEARNHRAGSEIHPTIFRYDIIASKTVDEHFCDLIEKKADIGQQLVSNLKSILQDF